MLDKVQQDLVQAMKAKQGTRVGALRLLLASLKNKQIELGHELSSEEAVSVIQKEVKQRKDSIQQYSQANRQDLVEQESAELAVLQEYMPAQMDEATISKEVEKAIQSTGAASPSDMGKVMAALSHLKGQADMAVVSNLVRLKLQ